MDAMRGAVSMGVLLLLSAVGAGCGLVSIADPTSGRSRRFATMHDGSGAHDSSNADEEPEAPLPPLGSCPSAMGVSAGARTLDTRKLPEARQSTFASGHQKAPPADFYLTADQAIEKVIALEKKSPGLLLEGFRKDLAQGPRDAALRMRVARCELETDATRRRASYDAAMALLLGAPKGPAMAILLESTNNGLKRDTMTSCTAGESCGGAGWSCDAVFHTCVNQLEKTMVHISLAELDVEDVLTRALVKPVVEAGSEYAHQPLFAWGAHRVHRCGGGPTVMCRLTGYRLGDDGARVVSWDLRDGGGSYSPPPNVQQWYRDHCARGSTTDCWGKKPEGVP